VGTIDHLIEPYVTRETLDADVDGWMAEVAPYQFRRVEPIRREGAALLVVDMTRPFVAEGGALASPAARIILPRVRMLVEAFRAAGRPVIWLMQGHHSAAHDRGGLLSRWWPVPILEGGADVEPAAGLEAAQGEKVILKRRYSGFLQTDLDLTLRCLEVTDVVVSGVLTNVCPLATALDAFMRGYMVYCPADGTASLNRELHVGALKTVAGWCGHVVRASEIAAWLAG
jgi:ureidoacrylate peracid hydrolase